MTKDQTPVFILLLMMSSLVSSYCPANKLQRLGPAASCSFRAYCRGIIRNITLPQRCQGSPNVPVRVDLMLTEAKDWLDNTFVSEEVLTNVVSLRISAQWPKTSLFLLRHMPNLEEIYLRDNAIEDIEATPFYYLNHLKNIDLAHNRLNTVPTLFQFETNPNNMKRLSLASNLIEMIPNGVFDELTSLVELDLSNNLLPNLTEEPFSNLTNLETLKLSNNKIIDLNGAVNKLFNLKHLFISGNNLKNIDDKSLDRIYHLETFDVSANSLEILKPTLFSRHWMHFEEQPICRIILSDNHIKHLPNATLINLELANRFTRTVSKKNHVEILTELDLSKNLISNIEYNAFQTIVKLTYLDLARNVLYDFIVNPEHLSHVKFLNLSSNYISTVYFRSFSSMKNLHNLDLSHNRMNDIPYQTFLNNNNLQTVNLTDNDLAEITSIRIPLFHDGGGKLDLSNNGLTSIQVPLGEARRLTMLVLDSNNITDASLVELTDQDDLTTLIMSKNEIGDLNKNSLHLPSSLTYLDLSDNVIGEIESSTFFKLSHLKMLRLSHNDLTAITYGTFHGLDELENLDLAYNSLSNLDSKVLRDLKFLRVLSLRYNEMIYLDDRGWFRHKFDLQVYLDGNNLTCDWLSTALINFDNGYSKMRPTVLQQSTAGQSLEGISCVEDTASNLIKLGPKSTDTDERLLANSQKILEAIREQTFLLKNFWIYLHKN